MTDERQFDVPIVLVCPEFTPAAAQESIAAGDVPELARAKRVDLVDIDSGDWPTRPTELAWILAAVQPTRSPHSNTSPHHLWWRTAR